jgi:hypothetical protein
MGRTFVRQLTQIQPSETYDDTIAPAAGMESAANLETDLNNIRSQISTILDEQAGNWYDDVPTVNSKKRSLLDLNTDLDDLEEKKLLCRASLLTDITVGGTDDYVLLSVAGSEAPTQVAAVALTVDGAVVAQSALSGAGFLVNELTEIAGSDAINPKNLLEIRDATTGQRLQSAGRDIFGLLQYESTGADGGAFNDTASGNRVKISFVRLTSGLDDLEACPAADIQAEVINYSYAFRTNLDSVPEDCFLGNAAFVDQSASVDVTRQTAYTNQSTTPVDINANAILDLETAGIQWTLRDSAENMLFQLIEGEAGGTSQVNIGTDVDELDIDAADVDFSSGIAVGSSGTEITINETAGEINRAGDLSINASSGEILLNDANFAGEGTWAQAGVKVSETQAEVAAYETAFGGEVSLINAITQAANAASSRTKTFAIVQSNIAADSNVGGPATANNLDVNLPALTGWTAADTGDATFVSENEVFLNGVLLRGGTSAGSNHDFYPGTTDVQLKFEFLLRSSGSNPDVLCVITR